MPVCEAGWEVRDGNVRPGLEVTCYHGVAVDHVLPAARCPRPGSIGREDDAVEDRLPLVAVLGHVVDPLLGREVEQIGRLDARRTLEALNNSLPLSDSAAPSGPTNPLAVCETPNCVPAGSIRQPVGTSGLESCAEAGTAMSSNPASQEHATAAKRRRIENLPMPG